MENIHLDYLSSQRSTFIPFFFVKGVMSISAIMSELFPQLVSMPNGFAPLFIHEQYLIASHMELLYRCVLIYNI